MSLLDFLAIKALHCLEPETAHKATLLALKSGLAPSGRKVADPLLKISLWGWRRDSIRMPK